MSTIATMEPAQLEIYEQLVRNLSSSAQLLRDNNLIGELPERQQLAVAQLFNALDILTPTRNTVFK